MFWDKKVIFMGLVLAFLAWNAAGGERNVLDLGSKGGWMELPPGCLDHLQSATVEAWVKVHALPASSSARIVSYGLESRDFGLHTTPSGDLEAFVQDRLKGYAGVHAGRVIQTQQWYHVAVVMGTNGMSLYLNGGLLDTNVSGYTGCFSSINNTAEGSRFRLGRAVVDEEPFVEGQLAEVRIWNSARTRTEIRREMFNELTGQEAGVVGLWNFRDGTGNDISTNRLFGRLVGQASVRVAELPAAADLTPWMRVRGHLSDDAGTRVNNATVTAFFEGQEIARTVSNQEGWYDLLLWSQTRNVQVVALGPQHSPAQVDLPFVEGSFLSLDWKLKSTFRIAGTVKALDGKTPHVRLRLELVKAAPQFPPSQPPVATHNTDAAGYEIAGRQNGSNRVLRVSPEESFVELPFGWLDQLSEATVEAWVKWNSPKASMVFSYGSDTSKFWGVGTGPPSRAQDLGILLGESGNPAHWLTSPSVLKTGLWCHVAATLSDRGMKFYINGLLTATNNEIRPFIIPKTGGYARIGQIPPPFPGGLDGEIDEVRLWKLERTGEQIREHLSSRLTGLESGLAALWNFDDSATPGRDSSTNRLDGRLTGEATTSAFELPKILYGRITGPEGQPLTNALVELRQQTGDRTIVRALRSGEYALTIPHQQPLDLIVTAGKLIGYRLGFEPTSAPRQQLDWSLEELSATAGDVLAITATDEDGRFVFSSVEPGDYQIRAQVLSGKAWLNGGEIISLHEPRGAESAALGTSLDFRLAPFKKGHWTTYNEVLGLPSNEIRKFWVDPDGLLWIATMRGVSRFDGDTFVNLTSDEGLLDDRVFNLWRQGDGIWWFCTAQGVSRYDPSAEKEGKPAFINYTSREGLCTGEIHAVVQTPDGTMWFGGDSLSRFDGQRFHTYSPDVIERSYIMKMTCAPDGNLWIGTGAGLIRFDGTNSINVTKEQNRDPGADSPTVSDNGVVWFGGRGVYRFDPDAANRGRPAFPLTWFDTQGTNVYSVQPMPDGRVWAATEGGAFLLDGTNAVNFNVADGLPDNDVLTVTNTPDGVVWFGTRRGGISRFEAHRVAHFTVADGLPAPNTYPGTTPRVSGGVTAGDGTMWITSGLWPNAEQGLARFNGQHFEALTLPGVERTNLISSLAVSQDGTLWIGTYGAGLSRFVDGRFSRVGSEEGFRERFIDRLGVDPHGKLWISAERLLTFDGRRFEEVLSWGNTKTNRIFAFSFGPGDEVGIGTDNGLLRYAGGRTERFTTDHGLANNSIVSLLASGSNDVWVGTFNGLTRFTGRNAVTFTKKKDRLGDNPVLDLWKDERDILWIGGFNGVTRFDGRTWSSLAAIDGLYESEVNSIWQDKEGSYWFGHVAGLTRYRPDRSVPRPPRISFLTDEEYAPSQDAVRITAGRKVLFKLSVNDLKTRAQTRRFRWQFSAGRQAPGASPLADGWLASTRETQFAWSTNRPGIYTFAAQYIDRDLNYSPLTLMTLKVVPVWYANAWIMLPAGGALMGLIGWGSVAGTLYMRKRRETERLRQRLLEEEQKARLAAEEASKAKSQFLANMSHELRTPLNAIIGYSEMLEEEAPELGAAPMVPDLQKIQTAAKHQLSLINDILDLSKIEAGKMTLYLEEFDASQLLNEVIATVKPLVAKKGNQLEVEYPPDLGSMRADQTKVRQVFFNLLSNASKFTENGTIRLTARRVHGNEEGRITPSSPMTATAAEPTRTTASDTPIPDRLICTITDTGIGMTADQIQKLFQAFTQADDSTSRKYGGTGLGLTLSRTFCRMMGGDLKLESDFGHGSTFTIILPMNVSELTAPQQPAVAKGDSPSGTTVLVIDDDPAVRDLMQRFLGKEGFRVLTASTGEEGLALARSIKPAVITLDVLMPGVDGWTVLSRLKAEPGLCEIPVVLVTITDDQNMGFTLGASEYLLKPIDWTRLSMVLHRYRVPEACPRVLVVEDDPATREYLQRQLEKAGWHVTLAENGKTALSALAQQRPSVILLDLMMPEMDGFEFVDELRRREDCSRIPVIVITAKELSPDDHQRLNGFVIQILRKGCFQPEELMAELRRVLARKPVHA